MSFFEELKRRNVVRVGIAYVLLGWVVMQAADFALDLIDAPNWIIQAMFIIGLAGLPIALFFAWAFEVTPEGIKREADVDRSQSVTPQTGRKLDRAIIVFLALAVVFLLARPYWQDLEKGSDSFSGQNQASTSESQPEKGSDPFSKMAAAEEKSVAVLPFLALSNGENDEYFADGLTEEILNALAQLPELLVTARTSSFSFKGQEIAVNDIAAQLGVQHIVEGSVRHSGERIRVTAQLIRAADGFNLWSETYDSTSADTITVQEDIAEQIATALDVVLDDDRRAAMRRVGLRDPAAFIAFQRGKAASVAAHGDDSQIPGLLAANRDFEEVLERVPDYAPAHTERADAYVHLINDMASEEPTVARLPEEVLDIRDDAYQIAVDAMSAARDNARSLEERNNNEFDLAVLTGDFRRLQPRLETFLASEGCDIGQWIDPIATVFGYAEALDQRLEYVVQCNPLGAVRRFSQARAALWAGDPDRALRLLTDAREQIDHPWLDFGYIFALISAGQFESANQELRLHDRGPFYNFLAGTALAAAQGEQQPAQLLLHALREDEGLENIGGFAMLQYHARLGERDAANTLAANIDERAFGPLPLILITMWCGCGAPFDLEATPNFAAALEQGDLPWPPDPVIEFPLKDW